MHILKVNCGRGRNGFEYLDIFKAKCDQSVHLQDSEMERKRFDANQTGGYRAMIMRDLKRIACLSTVPIIHSNPRLITTIWSHWIFSGCFECFFSSYTHYTYYALYAHFHLGIVCSNRRINFIWKVNNKQKKRKTTITISSMCKRQEFLDTTLSFTNEIKRKKTFSQLVSHVNASRPVDTIFSSSFSLWLCSSLSCTSH